MCREGASTYRPTVYSLAGIPASPRDGDVVSIYVEKALEHGSYVDVNVLLTLAPGRSWSFRTGHERPGVVLAPGDSGQEEAVGAHIYRVDDTLVDPLVTLSDKEIRGLWGLCVEVPTDRLADHLRRIDPARTCVKLHGKACTPEILSALPADLRYLVLENQKGIPLEGLSRLNRLVFLKVTGKADVTRVPPCRELSFLDLSCSLDLLVRDLRAFPSLRVLNLDQLDDLNSLDGVRTLKELRWLSLRDTGIADLSPVASLPLLHTVLADGTRVRALPETGFIALRRLSLTRTGISSDQADRFVERHPDCALSWSYTRLLAKALEGVENIRVRTGGTCHRGADERVLFETGDPREIRKVVSSLEVLEPRALSHCMCCGRPTLEFIRGGRVVVTLGIHHGVGLRWPSSEWTADADLTEAGAAFLRQWLTDHGVPESLRK